MNRLSFILPCYNESNFIADVLASITKGVDYLGDKAEIIVVDNGSTDNTSEIAASFDVKLISISKSMISYARNLGASQAYGDIFCFIDGDTVLTRQWFLEMNRFLELTEPGALVLTGSSSDIPDHPNWIEKSWFSNLGSKNYIRGGNLICAKSAFEVIGGFDEKLETGEDYEFCVRAVSKGIHLDINDNFRAIHLGYPQTLRAFVKREIWHGKGDAQSIRRFFSSKISIVSIVYAAILVQALIAFFDTGLMSGLPSLILLVIFNFILTFKRTKFIGIWCFTCNAYLNFFYFLSRSISPLMVIKDRLLKTRE